MKRKEQRQAYEIAERIFKGERKRQIEVKVVKQEEIMRRAELILDRQLLEKTS